ncbi:MAG: hypothetical protein ACUVSW_04600, partial [Roseiflexus sp.]
MAQRSLPSRTPAQAIKLFISAASVAATLAGWALLAGQNRTAAVQSEPLLIGLPTETVQPTIAAPPPAWLTAPPPIPTLQPLIAVEQPQAPTGFQNTDAGVVDPPPVIANPPPV